MDDEIPLQGGSHASSSHEVSLEPTTKRREDLGKHNVHTHFPKDRNCEICRRTKITRAPCRRRNGEAVPRAVNFGDLITADHTVLSDNCESRNNHRYAVVVQDLATQWIQAYPCKNKTSQETQRSLQKFLEPERKPKSVWREQKAHKKDRFFRGRQIAYLIYDHFRVIGSHDSVENYTDLFTNVLRNDDIQEFDSKWDGILLSMTKISHGDILEGLYKLRIRESEKFKTVLELYYLEIHQKKFGPDYHRLKTMVKRSIEQNLRIKNFEDRNGNHERNAVVKNQGTKQRVQRILGD